MKFALLAVLLTVLVATHSQAEDIPTAEIVAAFKEAGASQGLLDAISKLKSPQKKAANRAQLAVMGAGLGATDADKLIFPQAAAKLGIPN